MSNKRQRDEQPAQSTEQPPAQPPVQQSHNPSAKRKVALCVAYNGAKYQGLQKNPDAITVESVLETAMFQAGAISADNFGTLQKISWSRAGRTDKGVHAVGQVISAKLVLTPEPMVERINERLSGSGVRVLGCERTSNGFCAHTLCSSREYEYMLPAYCLRPRADAAPPSAPLDASVRARGPRR